MKLFKILFFIPYFIFSQNNEKFFDDASLLYNQENYQASLDNYLKVYNNGYESLELYYNIANCYYKLGLNSKSILFYEKALKIDSNDKETNFNLDFLNTQLIDQINNVDNISLFIIFDKVLHYLSCNQLVNISLLFFWVLILFIFVISITKKIKVKNLFFSLSLISFFFSLIFFILAIVNFYTIKDYAILIPSNIYIKSAPSIQSEDLFMLHEGVKMELIDNFDSWSKIKLYNGMTGWIKTEYVEVI